MKDINEACQAVTHVSRGWWASGKPLAPTLWAYNQDMVALACSLGKQDDPSDSLAFHALIASAAETKLLGAITEVWVAGNLQSEEDITLEEIAEAAEHDPSIKRAILVQGIDITTGEQDIIMSFPSLNEEGQLHWTPGNPKGIDPQIGTFLEMVSKIVNKHGPQNLNLDEIEEFGKNQGWLIRFIKNRQQN